MHCLDTTRIRKGHLTLKENIKKIQQDFGSQIEIMVGSGVNSSNIKMLKEYTNVNNFHLSAKHYIDSNMKFRHPVVSMGGTDFDEYSISIASYDEIKKVINEIRN